MDTAYLLLLSLRLFHQYNNTVLKQYKPLCRVCQKRTGGVRRLSIHAYSLKPMTLSPLPSRLRRKT